MLQPVYPWNFVRTNTIFGVIHAAGGYTAWSDKHPSYSAVSGPGSSGGNLDDYYSPEINSNVIPLPGVVTATGVNCGTVQDPTADLDRVDQFVREHPVLRRVEGRTPSSTRSTAAITRTRKSAPVPTIFGMNFQAVSVGQKFIEKTSTPTIVGGYTDARGDPDRVRCRAKSPSSMRASARW